MGGAGSGKSVFIQQKLIYRALSEAGIRILICRKTAASIRESVFADMKIRLREWKLEEYVQINQSNMTITFPNGSQMIFIGLDTETRLLSLADISCIFVEEAFEVEQTFVEQLNLRMRGSQPNQQILMAWNPISQSSWLYDFTVTNPPVSSVFIHSTFEDNPFLSEDYKNTIRELKTRNPVKWKIYGLGEWGSDPEGLVFRNWIGLARTWVTLTQQQQSRHCMIRIPIQFMYLTAIMKRANSQRKQQEQWKVWICGMCGFTWMRQSLGLQLSLGRRDSTQQLASRGPAVWPPAYNSCRTIRLLCCLSARI